MNFLSYHPNPNLRRTRRAGPGVAGVGLADPLYFVPMPKQYLRHDGGDGSLPPRPFGCSFARRRARRSAAARMSATRASGILIEITDGLGIARHRAGLLYLAGLIGKARGFVGRSA